MGGGGPYVSSTSKGAIAEYNHYNPSGPTPSVYQVKYRPGRNYTINPTPKSYTTGNIPLAADTLTTKSVRSPGTLNTIIRNNSLKKLKKLN
ncbi:MAG: hypothetical protein KAI03_03600 [Candidatus Aureabacteria bacterium]|nr:hypothetical protein [Candidatus Auribacterota bacterium]